MTTTHDELAEARAMLARPARTITQRERIAQLESRARLERGLELARELTAEQLTAVLIADGMSPDHVLGRDLRYEARLAAVRAAETPAQTEYEREVALRRARSMKGLDEAKHNLARRGGFERGGRPPQIPKTPEDDNWTNVRAIEAVPFGSVELVRETLPETVARDQLRIVQGERRRLERLPGKLWQIEDAAAGVALGEELRRARLARRGIVPEPRSKRS